MTKSVKTFYDMEIALMEHDLIYENAILDWRPEEVQMYIAGVNAMSDRIIKEIRKEEL